MHSSFFETNSTEFFFHETLKETFTDVSENVVYVLGTIYIRVVITKMMTQWLM